jgi:hypothetical protein
MKKMLFLVCGLSLTSLVSGLPVRNPADPVLYRQGVFLNDSCFCFDLRGGFSGDYVFNRYMRIHHADRSKTIRKTRIITNAGYIVLNLCDFIDVFTALGQSYIRYDTPQVAFNTMVGGNQIMYIRSSTRFSYSVGGAIAKQFGCWGIGLNGAYFRTKPRFDNERTEGGTTVYEENEFIRYWEWQGALGASYRINISDCVTAAIPYAAWTFSLARETTNDLFIGGFEFFDLKNDRVYGLAIGVTLLGCEKWSITGEGRFFNESAFHCNLQARF